MPELPEVETVVRGITPYLQGKTIRRLIYNRRNLRNPLPQDLPAKIAGQKIAHVLRRAKYILVLPEETNTGFYIHLGMSGRVRIHTTDAPYVPETHDHILLETEEGTTIAFNDPRRFGDLQEIPVNDWHQTPPFSTMGPEPLSNYFHADYLKQALMRKTQAIKPAIMDQRIVVGVGNIYACEALHRSGINPTRPAQSLDDKALVNLCQNIQSVLQEAINSGGSTLRDHRQADGSLGYFQHHFAVYDKAGTPCATCKRSDKVAHDIQKITQAGRSTFYCARCQI